MSTSGSSSSSRVRLPNTEALLMNTTPRSSSSSRRSLGQLSAESLSSTGTSSSSTGSVLPNTMKLLRVPATLVSPRPRSPRSPRSPGSPQPPGYRSPRRRSPRARSSGSPRRSSSPGSPQPPSWYRSLRRRYLRHRPPRSPRSPRSSSGWSSASPVFRRLKFTIKNKGDERATVFRVPRIAPPPAGALRRRHTYRRPASSSESRASRNSRKLMFNIRNKGDGRATVFRVPRIAPPPAGALRPYRLPPQLTRRSSIVFSRRPLLRSSSSSSLESPISLSPEILKKLPFSFGQAAALAAARGSPKGAKSAKNRSSSSFDSSN